MRLLLLCMFALAIPALCSEPQVRQRRSVNGGIEYFIQYRANLNQVYNLVANASLTGASWALAKPVWQVKVDKSTVNSSPLQNAALTIQVDSSCGALHSITTMGVIYYNNQTMGTYTDFYNSAYSYQCPIGAWVYDPDNNVASVYFQMEVDTEQVPICPFTLQFATGSSPNPKCAGSHPTYPGGPTPPGSSSGGISNGAIAGIVIGVGCAVVLVFAVIILIRRRNQNTSEYSQPLTSQPQETGYQTNSGETEHTYNRNGPAHTSGHTYV